MNNKRQYIKGGFNLLQALMKKKEEITVMNWNNIFKAEDIFKARKGEVKKIMDEYFEKQETLELETAKKIKSLKTKYLNN